MKLPLLISIPHAGLKVPPEVEKHCVLTPEQIAADSDEGAATIYALESEVTAYLTADIARAIVDLNRAENDRGPDGVVKTHTFQKAPVYKRPLSEETIERLLTRYYRPYHEKLTALAKEAKLGIDCHTMVEFGPPISPDPGCERPYVCLSDAEGTCPGQWFEQFAGCFKSLFGDQVSLNKPFKGGYIIRSHASELPWVQIELSRGAFLSDEQKHERVLQALTTFCHSVF
jgi:N-formylglutamate amidohydrolase